MPNIFALTDDIKAIAQGALDDLMSNSTDGGLGKTCRLEYPPTETPCPNCIWDPNNQCSSGRAKAGASQPFDDGTSCPVCGNVGKLITSQSEDVTMQVANAPAHFWVKPKFPAQFVDGAIQTKLYLTMVPKILRTVSMVVSPSVVGIYRWKYVRDGEPLDTSNIIQNRYAYVNWKRVP